MGPLLLGVLAFSCMPQSQVEAPQVKPSSTISLHEEGVGKLTPFEVVHFAPEGPTVGDPQIQVVFSHPLRPLDTDEPIPSALHLEPEVPGAWDWVGAHGVTFVPAGGRLPRGTDFHVRVGTELKDLSGTALPQPLEFSFQTPVPQVDHATPNQVWSDEKPNDPIELTFSQPIRANDVAPFITVEANGKSHEVLVSQGRNTRVIVLKSKDGFPLDSTITYQVRPGYRGAEGPVPASHEFNGKFKTYGPLTATVECTRNQQGACRPEGGLWLSLSNPVPARALARAIRAKGATLHVDKDWSPNAETSHISLGAELVPRGEFTIIVDPIQDIYGQPLRWVKNRQVRVGDLRPSVRIGFSGDSIPLETKAIGIPAVNASFELVTVPLSDHQLAELEEKSANHHFSYLTSQPQAKTSRVDVGPLNQTKRHRVALDSITKSGPFAVAIRYQREGQIREEVRWGQRTNLGLTIKQGRDQSYAWVTDLVSGAPVAGARVGVVGESDFATTDARGVAQLKSGVFVSRAGKQGTHWLGVTRGEDRAYRANTDAIGEWRLNVATDFYGDEEDLAFLFPERDLFRPGEKAWLKAYVRRPGRVGNAPIKEEKFDLVLVSPSGEEVERVPVRSSRFGAVSAQLTIPATAQLGDFTAQLRRGEQPLASTTLQVAEFRPAEFEVKVHPGEPEVIAGDQVRFHVAGNYFYGGVMGEAKTEYSFARHPAHFSPPGYDEYVVDDDEWQYHEAYRDRPYVLSHDEGALDNLGQMTRETSAQLKDQVGPEYIEFEATVHDLSGQTDSARASALVHPASYYVALKRPESYLVDAPSTFSPEVLTVSPQGTVISGRSVKLDLYRLRWTQVKRKGSADSSESVTELVKDFVGTCTISTTAKEQSCPLQVKNSGAHVLRASSTDAKGRVAHSSTSFYAVGGGGASSWRDFDERGVVELQSDRDMYQPGQTARILVKSPFKKARAWVTVERDGVLEEKIVPVSGPSPTINVPISEKMRPNAFVGVHLLEDRKAVGKTAHAMSASYRFGYVELRIDPERQRLAVNVSSEKKDYRPGEEVELDVRVQDNSGRGRTAEVAIFVVDEGVLTLSGYQLPDPLKAFTAPRPLRVETIEGRETIARLFGLEPNGNENKGDPGGGGGEDRVNLITTAYFNPSLITDKSGRAKTKFTLPDNIGRFRIMALAVTEDDRYGKGQNAFAVNRPLMVRPALPRFLRTGDEFEVSAVVSSLGLASGEVEVTATGDGIAFIESAKRKLTLAQDGSKVVSFRARAPRTGPVKIRFAARGAKEDDAIVLERTVESPARIEAVALYGKTKDAEAHQIGALSEARRDMGGLDVTLSSSALVGLEGGFEQLYRYPYLCSEQLASRILPLVMLQEFAQLYGVEAPEDAQEIIDSSVAGLVRRQRGDGGFGMWPESEESSPWVSAYALWVLAAAEKRGSIIGKELFERGARYLQDVAKRREDENLATAAFAAFSLSEIGRGDKNTVNALHARLDQMDVESQMLLLWAASSTGATKVRNELLKRATGAITLRGNEAEITAPHGDSWAARMGSPTRLQAIALSALVSAKPDHPMAAALVRGLLSARRGNGWGSTQESAFALVALDAYRRAQEKEEPEFNAFVFLEQKLLGKAHFIGRSTLATQLSVEMADLAAGGALVFQQKGSGTLFFEARLKYARKTLPKDPLEHGFLVQKTMTPLGQVNLSGPEKPISDQRTMKHGDLCLVDLTVLVPTRRRFVAIDDPLPAGLEGIDMSLSTTQGSLGRLLETPRVGYSHAWYRSEVRDDRVLYFIDDMPPGVYRYRYLARATTRGRFIVPPTFAKEMYQEEVYGRTAARSVVVQ